MVKCDSCGGLGRVAAGGMTCHAGAFWSPAGVSVRECRQCHGTGEAGEIEAAFRPMPAPRRNSDAAQRIAGSPTAARVATQTTRELARLLEGEWIVEVHGYLRLLAVLRFQLAARQESGRFDARCDFGGPPGWEATGTWTVIDPGKLRSVREPGWRFMIPLADKMRKVSLRTVTMPIPSQQVITKDNVSTCEGSDHS